MCGLDVLDLLAVLKVNPEIKSVSDSSDCEGEEFPSCSQYFPGRGRADLSLNPFKVVSLLIVVPVFEA